LIKQRKKINLKCKLSFFVDLMNGKISCPLLQMAGISCVATVISSFRTYLNVQIQFKIE